LSIAVGIKQGTVKLPNKGATTYRPI